MGHLKYKYFFILLVNLCWSFCLHCIHMYTVGTERHDLLLITTAL